MMTLNAELVHRCFQVCSSWNYMATMAVVKEMLHNPNQYTNLLMTD